MLVAIATNGVSLLLVYGLVFTAGVASAFDGPSRQALIPALVPRYLFSRAMTLNSTLQSLSSVSGPAVAGLLIAWQGIGLAYAGHLSLILVSMLVLLPVRVARSSEAARAGMRLDAFVTWRVPALRNHQRRFSS